MENIPVPAGAWDSHIHVFDPDKFPYAEPRPYTPAAAPIQAYLTSVTGCTNIVVVHASMQGSSPTPLTDTLSKQASSDGLTLRRLVTVDIERTTEDELRKLHAAGVRGVRLHEMSWGHGRQNDALEIATKVEILAKRLAPLGWVIDVFCPLQAWADMAELIRYIDPRVKLLADHFASAFPGDEDTEAFATVLGLLRENKLHVKLSGFERLYHDKADRINSLTAVAKAIIGAGPDQIMFGSDWPHTQLGWTRKGKTDMQRLTEIEGFRHVDDESHVKKLREWIPDPEVWHKLWDTNPQRLFG